MRNQLPSIPTQRKSKIQLTCRLSAQKLHGCNKQNLTATPPKHSNSTLLHIQPLQCSSTSQSPNLSVKTISKPPPKKTKRKQSVLQIDIDCIEDEYSKKSVIYQDTPLFASVDKNMARRESGKVQTLNDVQQERQSSLVIEEKEKEKYSYDHLINAIKINYRNQGAIEEEIRGRVAPMLVKEEDRGSVTRKEKSMYNTNETVPDPRMTQQKEHSFQGCPNLAMEQLNKVRNQVNALRDILKVNAKVCQMVYLIDDLERQLIQKQHRYTKTQIKQERYSKPLQRQYQHGRQSIIRNSCQAVQIENSTHFQSIHRRQYDSKQQMNSSKLLKKFNTNADSDEVLKPHEIANRNANTKSPFRQIMNYMNRRR